MCHRTLREIEEVHLKAPSSKEISMAGKARCGLPCEVQIHRNSALIPNNYM